MTLFVSLSTLSADHGPVRLGVRYGRAERPVLSASATAGRLGRIGMGAYLYALMALSGCPSYARALSLEKAPNGSLDGGVDCRILRRAAVLEDRRLLAAVSRAHNATRGADARYRMSPVPQSGGSTSCLYVKRSVL